MSTTEPSPEQRKAAVAGVFDRAAATYDQVGVEFFGPAGELLVRRTAPTPGERVLDVGCGRGASALPAARLVGPAGAVTATDLAPAMVEAVRRQAADLPWLTAELGDAEQPPPGPFDVVQGGLVMFFLPDFAGALDRYRAALVPGGRLGFTWSWSQGYRTMLERIEAHGALDEARARVEPLLERLADDGGLEWRALIRCTLARS